MKHPINLLLFLSTILLLPSPALAARKLQDYLSEIVSFINNIIIPFIFAIAVLFFFVNITRYYIIEGADAYSREQAKKYALYAIIALVFITSIWGIIGLVMSSIGLNRNSAVCPDYVTDCETKKHESSYGSYDPYGVF